MEGKRAPLPEIRMEEEEFCVQIHGGSRFVTLTKEGLVRSLRLLREVCEEL